MKINEIEEVAVLVGEECNQAFYSHMVQTIATSARELGLMLGEAPRPDFTENEFDTLAKSLAGARRLYLSPDTKSDMLARGVEQDMEDGYAQMWPRSILSALDELGIYLYRP